MMDNVVSIAVGDPGHGYDLSRCSRTCWILRFLLTRDIIYRYVFWGENGDHIGIWAPTCHRKLCWCSRCMHVAPAVNHELINRNHGKRHHFMSKLFMPQIAMLSVIVPPTGNHKIWMIPTVIGISTDSVMHASVTCVNVLYENYTHRWNNFEVKDPSWYYRCDFCSCSSLPSETIMTF